MNHYNNPLVTGAFFVYKILTFILQTSSSTSSISAHTTTRLSYMLTYLNLFFVLFKSKTEEQKHICSLKSERAPFHKLFFLS